MAPRLGFSYLLTEDAKNVLRGSYVRIHQQLMGTRHPVAAFGGDVAAGLRDTYDANGDGQVKAPDVHTLNIKVG